MGRGRPPEQAQEQAKGLGQREAFQAQQGAHRLKAWYKLLCEGEVGGGGQRPEVLGGQPEGFVDLDSSCSYCVYFPDFMDFLVASKGD